MKAASPSPQTLTLPDLVARTDGKSTAELAAIFEECKAQLPQADRNALGPIFRKPQTVTCLKGVSDCALAIVPLTEGVQTLKIQAGTVTDEGLRVLARRGLGTIQILVLKALVQTTPAGCDALFENLPPTITTVRVKDCPFGAANLACLGMYLPENIAAVEFMKCGLLADVKIYGDIPDIKRQIVGTLRRRYELGEPPRVSVSMPRSSSPQPVYPPAQERKYQEALEAVMLAKPGRGVLLGRCHEKGWGTPQNLSEAVQCYRSAIGARDGTGHLRLGLMLNKSRFKLRTSVPRHVERWRYGASADYCSRVYDAINQFAEAIQMFGEIGDKNGLSLTAFYVARLIIGVSGKSPLDKKLLACLEAKKLTGWNSTNECWKKIHESAKDGCSKAQIYLWENRQHWPWAGSSIWTEPDYNSLLKRAAIEDNSPKAQCLFGVELCLGRNGFDKDYPAGLALLEMAKAQGYQEAESKIAMIEERRRKSR